MKVAFVVIILVWLSFGFVGLLNCKKDRINWGMLAFFFCVPFLPIVAKFFEIL